MGMGKRRLLFAGTALLLISFLLLFLFLHPRNRTLIILSLGDSLTSSSYGSYLPSLGRALDKAEISHKIVDGGRPGHTSGEYLSFLRNSPSLFTPSPDIVLLMLGTNDVRSDGDKTDREGFRRHMNGIIDLVLAQGSPDSPPRIFLIIPPPLRRLDLPTFDGDSPRRLREEIVPELESLAKTRHLKIVDLRTLFLEHPRLLPGVHPSSEGYRAMGLLIGRSLVKALSPP